MLYNYKCEVMIGTKLFNLSGWNGLYNCVGTVKDLKNKSEMRLLFMNQELKKVIKNAEQSTLKVDGYGKLILQDENGHYSFTRNYEGYKPYEGEKIIGEIIPHWENGILKAKYKNL